MKRFIKVVLGLILVVGVMAGGLALATRNSSGELAGVVDRFNPLVPEKVVYIKTTDPETVNGYGTAHYKQLAADEKGQARTIEFDGLKKFRRNYFMKLKSKGAYVSNYKIMPKEAVPQAALAVLEMN
ncbi:YxeA family protein [Lapidilactobacillus gannanensis]|jgi:uncharacterized protein (TIGR01655 family)|uniref:YxeA family protein n=1 Tax=Lapidilactobacillus gannanensis TaxID=2486002 RepID=A0ABW4BLX8_9LACO|nr:YxeA family protein [Lapidilactobacillus gannanensis]MCH4056879.1 YxeA family protein [Lactobacillaceae bacterium]